MKYGRGAGLEFGVVVVCYYYYTIAALFLPLSKGLQCHSCSAAFRDGILTGGYCVDAANLAKRDAPLPKSCSMLGDAYNAAKYDVFINNNPQDKYSLACEKVTIRAGSSWRIDRKCSVVEKRKINSCPTPTREQMEEGERLALQLGASDNEAKNVRVEICLCDDSNECNSASERNVYFLRTLLFSTIIGRMLV